MMNKRFIVTLLFLGIAGFCFSQDIVYKPISVLSGGDAFSYQQVLTLANAQNDFQESNANQFEQPSEIENFTDNLNRQLLNSLSQSLFQEQIGSEDLTVGTYVFGSLVVEVTPGAGGLSVSILNTSTGEQTQITIPGN
ncbi:curli assembly protein CsgF [Tenacibaculum aquimarinum]|uniref:curli assembly protein CsgF n=1 Tax=Tenacibaculum aquimarinum TaxID=2910675 RepID=UPI001F0B1C67|nr:curli assembly protein CsgF [Tenacibaculum aquimarinum]MCH3882799.1 curli assembly protein CsgF [Tenacibaculum aquimarinum]